MTEAFGVPLAIHARTRDGSLRACAGEAGVPLLLYEAGEALRFNEMYIRAGVQGIINVMRAIGMLGKSRRRSPLPPPLISDDTTWLRAPDSGILRALVPLGARVVETGDLIQLLVAGMALRGVSYLACTRTGRSWRLDALHPARRRWARSRPGGGP